MTKTLTEQWLNEELPIALYYVIDKLGRETIGNDCGIRDMMVDSFNGGNIFIKEVLAPVPSYDEYLYLKTNNDHWNKEAIRISKQASCIVLESYELVQKMHILEKKLAIAMDTLEMLAHLRKEFDGRYREFAKNGIKQIKDVK